jgi:hypothetical protein
MSHKKYWFFVEGSSEEQFVIWCFRKKYHHIKHFKSEYDFVEENNHNSFYVTNCESGDKIPHKINEIAYRIYKANNCNVIVVCDLEKLPCPLEKKKKLKKIINGSVDESSILHIFSMPMIEDLYCSEVKVSTAVLKYFYEKNQNIKMQSIDASMLTDLKISVLQRLKNFHRAHGLTYKKVQFAERFFSQLIYDKCHNDTVKRLLSVLK